MRRDAAGTTDMCYAESGSDWVRRRYWTREERKRWLEEYAAALEGELKGVRERIQELSAA
ncbi:MAG TPA: DUF5320 domain-containing protein [Candidatus Thermoplasmatota archaeon]|nr:DUF5320 domain-containing protein [Candidatus Thermoplasmatota archaeon]